MHQFEHLRLHPERPQIRQIKRAVTGLQQGLFVVVPTDTTYVLMCKPESSKAIEEIRKLRQLGDRHLWSVVCANLSQAATCTSIDNQAHRILKRCLPGAYTFILPASASLPRRIFGKRRDVGIRIPNHPVCQMLLQQYGGVLLCTTLAVPVDGGGDDKVTDEVAVDPDVFIPLLQHLSCIVLDAGWGGMVPTTVVDLCDGEPELLREGAGDWPA